MSPFFWKPISVNTEITDNNAATPSGGWVCFDGECSFCRRWLRRVERPLLRHGFKFVPLQTDWARARLNLTTPELLQEMRLLRANQPVLGGADAAVVLMRYVWWLWPLWLVSRIPGAMPVYRVVYRIIANNRHCVNGACAIPRKNNVLDWLPVVLLPAATVPMRPQLPAWIFMWAFVTAMFIGCKWLTWRRAKNTNRPQSFVRTFGYWCAWPGMDAREFLTGQQPRKPKASEWFWAGSRFVLGIVLVWFAAHETITGQPVTNAWIAMFGLTLILHFGWFQLLALFWQRAGVPAKPLMQSPTTATSLAEFWGVRWNTAFNKLVHDLAFRPLARQGGIAWATLGVFAISGIVHELAISFPARGGYGLPLGYFMLQGLGVMFERSRIGQALSLGHGWRGWLFMLIFTAAPAYWLFHPPFIHNVILPMLQFIGAI
jgi:predicted DCC family thiol-disulfide oxidoreductase YuxK